MAEDTPSDGELPVDPLFGDWLNGSPAKGGATSGGAGGDDTRFMDAVTGGSGGPAAQPPAPESTPFSEAVFGEAALAGPANAAGTSPADIDSPFGAAVVGDGAVSRHRLTRPLAMAGIITLVGAGWLGVWVGISPGARHDLGDVLRTIPGGTAIVPASQQHASTSHPTSAAAAPHVTSSGTASPSVAGLNISGVLQPALFQAGAVSPSAHRTIARHAPAPDTQSSPGQGGVTVTGGGIPTPTPPDQTGGSPDPSQPGGWGTNPSGTPTGGPTTSPSDPTTDPPSTTPPTTDPPTTDPPTTDPPSTTPPTTDPPTTDPPTTDPPTTDPPTTDPVPTDTFTTDPVPTDTTTTDPGPTDTSTDTGSPTDAPT